MAQINESTLGIEWWGIDDVTPYENNPRNNDASVDKVAASIMEFGWQQPIVVDDDGIVIVGHTRLKAARKLGLDKVPVTRATNLTPEQAKAYRLADNKVADFADWDIDAVKEELGGIEGIDMSQFGDWSTQTGPAEHIRARMDEDEAVATLDEPLTLPATDILDGRNGYWQNRERAWERFVQDNGEGRHEAHTFSDSLQKYGSYRNISILDPVLCEAVCTWFLPRRKGALCIDPFAGDTSFGYVSSALGASFRGIELRREQVDFNQAQVDGAGLDAKYYCDDGQNILDHIERESADLLFSCPPYFDLEVYSDNEKDASNQSTYDEFYRILDRAFTNACACLKNDRFAVIVVGDVRNKKTSEYYNFPDDIRGTFTKAGLTYFDEFILLDPPASAAVRADGHMKGRKMVHTHQNVLVFYKGDPAHIKDTFPIPGTKEEA